MYIWTAMFFLGFYLFIPQFFASMHFSQSQSHNSLKSPFIFLLLGILPWLSLYFCIYFQKANSLQLYLGKNKNVSCQNIIPPNCILAKPPEALLHLKVFAAKSETSRTLYLRSSTLLIYDKYDQSKSVQLHIFLFIDQLFYCFTRVHLLYERNR